MRQPWRSLRFLTTLILLAAWSPLLRAQDVDKKEPAPDEAAQGKAEKLIKELYKSEYAKKRPADLRVLAAKLLQEAQSTKDNPVTRFVLIRESMDLAAQAGDSVVSLRAVDEMAKRFVVEILDYKLVALEIALKSAVTQTAFKSVVDAALELSENAVAEDKYELALKFTSLAENAVHRTKNALQAKQIAKRSQEVHEIEKEYQKSRPVADTLKVKPDDPDANLALGKFLGLGKGDWDMGLPMLARGSDEKWKALAKRDLEKPALVTEQIEVGDGWWDLAQAETGSAKLNLLRRANYWYQLTVSKAVGIDKTKLEKRLVEIEKVIPLKLPKPMARWTFERDATDVIGNLDGKLYGGAVVVNSRLRLNGNGACVQTVPLPRDVKEKTLEIWLALPTLDQSGVAMVMAIEVMPLTWDGIYYAAHAPKKWYPASSYNDRSQDLTGPAETARPNEWLHLAIIYAADDSITLYRNGKIYGDSFSPKGKLQTFQAGTAFVFIGSHPNGERSLAAEVKEARLYERALTAKEVAASYRASTSGNR